MGHTCEVTWTMDIEVKMDLDLNLKTLNILTKLGLQQYF